MLTELARLLVLWRPMFHRHITWVRVISVLLGLIVASGGRRTLTASIVARGKQFASWAPDYLAFSRAPWQVAGLFDAVVDATIDTLDRTCPTGRYLVVAVDDTGLPKTGKAIKSARWMRDPMSPPFQVNLQWGLRYVHLAAILPLYQQDLDPRAISIAFAPAPAIKNPGKKATDQQLVDFKECKKQQNLSKIAMQQFTHLREHLDATGQHDRQVLMVGDGSYTNSNVLKNVPERIHYLGRTRRDLALYAPATPGGRKVYGERLPTPEAMRQDPQHPWTHTKLFYAGAQRVVRFKEMNEVLWPRGGQRRLLRVLVIAPTPYRAPGRGKRLNYRDPAYLLTTDLTTPAEELIQSYLARWQIEVEHRDLKTGLGVGQAQVWSDRSVARLHSAHVAMWSMVKLAALRALGLTRTAIYPPRPEWYPQQPNDRASLGDIVAVLRADLQHCQPTLEPPGVSQQRAKRQSTLPPKPPKLATTQLLAAA